MPKSCPPIRGNSRRRIYKAHPTGEWRTSLDTCPLVQSVPHLVSGSCSSPRAFALGFLPTPPRGDAVALSHPFGFSYTWRGDFHPASYVPCSAHTTKLTVGNGAQRNCRRCSSLFCNLGLLSYSFIFYQSPIMIP